MVPLLLLDQVVHAVEGHPAVVAYDPAPAVGIGKACDDVGVPGLLHFRGIGIEHGLVMGLVVVGEDLVQLGAGGVAVGGAGLLRHLDAAVGHEGPLQGLVGLQSHHLFQVLVGIADIPGTVGQRSGNHLGLHIQNAPLGPLLLLQGLQIRPQGLGGLGGSFQEGCVSLIGGIVGLNKIPDVDLVAPLESTEPIPGRGRLVFVFCVHGQFLLNDYKAAIWKAFFG